MLNRGKKDIFSNKFREDLWIKQYPQRSEKAGIKLYNRNSLIKSGF